MATYSIAEAPEITVKVRGKDSKESRIRAIDKIKEMLDEGKLPTDLPNGLSIDDLVLVEAEHKNDSLSGEDDSESTDPIVDAVRKLNKFASIKLRLSQVQQSAIAARQQINILFDNSWQSEDIEQIEEALKASFKTLKEFAAATAEYKQALPTAINAQKVLDEALGVKEEVKTPASIYSGS